MACYTVGCVPYINAIPLVDAFEQAGADSAVKVVYDVPSKLPGLLDSGQADAILVSSVDALRTPGRRMAAGVCIGSRGAVKSVRLFSKVPFAQIQTLALDASSMTSNRLAQIVLAERSGVRPEVVSLQPDLSGMLSVCDACVLIGDLGMSASEDGLFVADLGREWFSLTGLPFVWAAWIGDEGLIPELADELVFALEEARGLDALVAQARGRTTCSDEVVSDYFAHVMEYRMGEDMLAGLREFQRRLLANGFEDCTHFPELVRGTGVPGAVSSTVAVE